MRSLFEPFQFYVGYNRQNIMVGLCFYCFCWRLSKPLLREV
jgi:hypothetical protein